ncbi:MAG TPA: metal ABC transporter permease, partial [Bdellovibrionota bacterium]|nr:metal ABC transporter permease [Bdellovibrionota bacterium]
MNNLSPEMIIMMVGMLVGASCALVGSFLVLRKMSLIGDAISHSVLPGIAFAFFISQSRATIPMFLGAGALGILTVFLIESLFRTKRMGSDASIGIVFPALFALGVILISKYAAQVDLDLDCVLYGEIAYTPWDILIVAGRSVGPKALWVVGSVTILNLLFVILFYKELKISTFDPALAFAIGFSPTLIHYLLMIMVSLTTVASFESVGAILVVAMLIVPASAAYLLTDRLGVMILLSVIIGMGSAIGGYQIAHRFDASIAGAMAGVAGLIFLFCWLFSPRYGILAKLIFHRRMERRVAQRLLLGHLYQIVQRPTFQDLINRFRWSPKFSKRVTKRLLKNGFAILEADRFHLTPLGREKAKELAG